MITLSRIIKYGWQSFLRNGWLSVSTIGIMILALIVFEGLLLFNVIGTGAIQSIKEKVDITVYFKSTATEDSILDVKKSLEGLSEVRDVEYVSKELALKEFKERHAGEEVIAQTLEELDENPLLASLNIKARDLSEYGTIAAYLESPALDGLVEKVNFSQNEVVINRLIALIAAFKRGGIALAAFLAFLAIMVTFNTIRLAIFSNSEQLSIMRFLGASNGFIRGPYIVEGVLYGVIGALISFFIMLPVVGLVSPHLANFIPGVNLSVYIQGNIFSLLFYQVFWGVALGIISGAIATRKYLRI